MCVPAGQTCNTCADEFVRQNDGSCELNWDLCLGTYSAGAAHAQASTPMAVLVMFCVSARVEHTWNCVLCPRTPGVVCCTDVSAQHQV